MASFGQYPSGPRSTEDINADFDSDIEIQDLNFNPVDGWTPKSWYEHLNMSSQNLADNCAKKGLSQEGQDIVKAWGTRLYSIETPNIGDPNRSKKLNLETNSRQRDLPAQTKKEYLEYLNTFAKQSEKQAYQNCDLDERHIKIRDKVFCEGKMSDPRLPISSKQDLEVALSTDFVSDESKYQMQRCFDKGYYATIPRITSYKKSMFRHLPNIGMGDCLFIAFAHYMKLVEQLNGVFPDPLNDNSGLPDIKPYPRSAQGILSQEALTIRTNVVNWLRNNLDLVLNNGLTVGQELAISTIDHNRNFIMTSKERINAFNSFILKYPEQAILFNFRKSRTLNVEHINSVIVDEHEDTKNLINHLVEYYLDSMSKSTTYGGQPEVIALAHLYNVNTIVLQESSITDLATNQGYNIRGARGTVYLYHVAKVSGKGGNHYEVQFPIPLTGAKRQASPPAAAPPIPDQYTLINNHIIDSTQILKGKPIEEWASIWDENQSSVLLYTDLIINIPSVNEVMQEGERYLDLKKINVDEDFIIVLINIISDFLSDESLSVHPEELWDMNLTEIFELLDSLIDNHESYQVQCACLRLFILSFYCPYLGYIAMAKQDGAIPILGLPNPPLIRPLVKHPEKLSMKTIIDIIQIFFEYIEI